MLLLAEQTMATATAPRPPTPSRLYRGVHRLPSRRWAAHVAVAAGDRRLVGHFRTEEAAALAHDRAAIALSGGRAPLNFPPAFSALESEFLRRCDTGVVLQIVGDGTYEPKYGAFLRAVFDSGSRDFTDAMIEFFIDRRHEIGSGNLDAGGEALKRRFVEMHANRATNASWVSRFHANARAQQQSSSSDVNSEASGAM